MQSALATDKRATLVQVTAEFVDLGIVHILSYTFRDKNSAIAVYFRSTQTEKETERDRARESAGNI